MAEDVAGGPTRPPVAQGTKKMLITAAFVVGGGALGFAYYKLVGCSTGACPITSNPWISTLYGALIGYFVGTGVR
jgi:hypothetical protein